VRRVKVVEKAGTGIEARVKTAMARLIDVNVEVDELREVELR
jgi:hypothetical protein